MGQLCVLQAGNVDFYGYTRYWVPRLSWDTYNTVLDSAIDVYTTLEASYIQYHAALDQQEEINHEAQKAASTVDSTLQKMEDEKLELVSTERSLLLARTSIGTTQLSSPPMTTLWIRSRNRMVSRLARSSMPL
jgi:hypothetical protein